MANLPLFILTHPVTSGLAGSPELTPVHLKQQVAFSKTRVDSKHVGIFCCFRFLPPDGPKNTPVYVGSTANSKIALAAYKDGLEWPKSRLLYYLDSGTATKGSRS